MGKQCNDRALRLAGEADYTLSTSTLTFTSAALTQCALFSAVDDDLVEGMESFVVSSPISNTNGTVSIADNDGCSPPCGANAFCFESISCRCESGFGNIDQGTLSCQGTYDYHF